MYCRHIWYIIHYEYRDAGASTLSTMFHDLSPEGINILYVSLLQIQLYVIILRGTNGMFHVQ